MVSTVAAFVHQCSRVDVFYLLDDIGLTIMEDNMIIVGADHIQYLNTVHGAGTGIVRGQMRSAWSAEKLVKARCIIMKGQTSCSTQFWPR